MTGLSRWIAAGLFTGSLVCGPAAAAPATQPSDREKRISSLIAELGHDEFTTRERASQELAKMGEDALPALREATTSPDPSVQSYAAALVRRLEQKEIADESSLRLEGNVVLGDFARVQGHVRWAPRLGDGFDGRVMMVGQLGTARSVVIVDEGRQVQIAEDDGGIQVTVTDHKAGKTENYTAKNEKDLQERHPQAHALYGKYKAMLARRPAVAVLDGKDGFRVGNNQKAVRVAEGGRVIEIREDGDGGKLTAVVRDGATQKIMSVTEADSAAELKKVNPELGKVYERFAHLMEAEGVPVLKDLPHLNRLFRKQNEFFVPRDRWLKGADETEARLESALKEAGVAEEQRKQVMERVREAQRERPAERVVIEVAGDEVEVVREAPKK